MLVAANIFQPLIDVFETVLKAIHSVIGGSWGWSIVLLTVLIRAVLLPLTVKQFHSMQKLQQLQPEMKAIQTKYKDDKQRQQQELMKFYKENQVNPLGSCLPLVAQLPVFISLFYMLRSSLRIDICPQTQLNYQLEHHIISSASAPLSHAHTVPCGPNNGAGFLFIPDLTNKATGAVLVVLIVLYVGTQLASSLMMSSPTMDRTQRQIMLLLPLLFVIFIINFPAGVIVYWITTNTWTMGQQYIIKRRIGPLTPLPAAAAGGGGGGGGGSGGLGGGGGGSGGPNGGGNGAGGGGLAGLLRGGRTKTEEPASVGGSTRGSRSGSGSSGGRSSSGDGGSGTQSGRSSGGKPPPPPRKKKKRSGRRR
jgi:YidC/Oxa1 family membrane protein insertase